MKYQFNSAIVALIFSITFSNSLISDEPTESEVLEEVVVVGIKASLKDAIAIKRSNVGVVEAITAEDFGKFPDGNLAESLARVVGVGNR
jgi:outer membrane receptor for ferrienterochelin and colicin